MNEFIIGETSISVEYAERIYRAVKHKYHKEDILMVLEEMEILDFDKRTISDIVDIYDNKLENSGVWHAMALEAVNEVLEQCYRFDSAEQCLIDNGIYEDEAFIVLLELCCILFDKKTENFSDFKKSSCMNLERFNAAKQCLIDNGIDEDDEACVVLQALCYILLNEETEQFFD